MKEEYVLKNILSNIAKLLLLSLEEDEEVVLNAVMSALGSLEGILFRRLQHHHEPYPEYSGEDRG